MFFLIAGADCPIPLTAVQKWTKSIERVTGRRTRRRPARNDDMDAGLGFLKHSSTQQTIRHNWVHSLPSLCRNVQKGVAGDNKEMVGTTGLEPATSTVSILRSTTQNPFPILLFRVPRLKEYPQKCLVLMAN